MAGATLLLFAGCDKPVVIQEPKATPTPTPAEVVATPTPVPTLPPTATSMAASAPEASPAATQSDLEVVPTPAAGTPRFGMWAWHPEPLKDQAALDELITFCASNGLNTILMQTKFTDGQLDEGFKRLIRAAAEKGIRVETLDGSAEMGFASERPKTLKNLEAILDLHQSLPKGAGLAGVHYDIEPYGGEVWKKTDDKGKEKIMVETLETMKAIQAMVQEKAPELTVAHDIPAWYDKRAPEFMVEFEGKRKNFHEHIQDLSDYIVVMSYRRKANGNNSVVEITRDEMAYAGRQGKTACAALETMKLDDEPTITFYKRDPREFQKVAAEVNRTLKNRRGYGGVFLHHYQELLTMLKDTDPFWDDKSTVQNTVNP